MWILLRLAKRLAKTKDKASILVNTLWILVILSLLAFAMAWRMSLELKLSNYFVSQLKDLYAAKAGVMYAMDLLQKRDKTGYDALDDVWAKVQDFSKEVGDANFAINNIQDEERKVNLNLGNNDQEIAAKLAPLLNNLKEILDAGDTQKGILTDEIIGAILDWRDSNKSSWIEASKPEPAPSRNGKFRVWEELLLLKGVEGNDLIDTNRFEKLRKYFTSYPLDDGRINVNTAEEEVLKAVVLAMNPGSIGIGDIVIPISPNDASALADWLIAGRIFKTQEALVESIRNFILTHFSKYIPPEKTAIAIPIIDSIVRPIIKDWLKVNSSVFQISVEAEIRGSIKKNATVVFDRSQSQVLYWHED